jgi:uncharacterized protein (DUF433 family)
MLDDTVQETEGVCGGYPCVGDTRISVRCLVIAFRQLGGDIAGLAGAFPTLPRHTIRAALDWYILHPARVEEDIKRNVLPGEDGGRGG